jgi:hypothetical protein
MDSPPVAAEIGSDPTFVRIRPSVAPVMHES